MKFGKPGPTLPPLVRSMLLNPVLAGILLLCCASRALGGNVITNVEYGIAGTNHLFLDACVPAGAGPFPVGIIVHGGGWCQGDKEHDVEPMEAPLAAAGFTWFAIDYRLGPTNLWPACYEDVQTAIRWVKAHAGEYKGDTNRLVLCGYSAGGHLACLAATQARADTRVQAVVAYAPPADMVADNVRRDSLSKALQQLLNLPSALTPETKAKLAAMSPIEFVKPGLPPFLLVQGDADKTVLYTQTVNFQARLLSMQVPCDLITITNAQHRIADWKKYSPGFEDAIRDWLLRTVGK